MERDILFLFVGVVLGFFANVFVVFFQFKHSIAGKRVDWVVSATREFASKKATTHAMRNRYRYSLGIIIEDMSQADPVTIRKEDNSWPVVVNFDEHRDRWHRFDSYVRPVMNDINSYAFLGAMPYRELSPRLKQLHYLVEFLAAIEDVVMRIDATHDALQITTNSIRPLKKEEAEKAEIDNYQAKVDDVADGYVALHRAWQDWLRQCEAQEEIRWSSSSDEARDAKDC